MAIYPFQTGATTTAFIRHFQTIITNWLPGFRTLSLLFPSPPRNRTNWDFQFPRRATRIFFNEFKHRRSHRSISILIRRVYNGATSKGNGEIVSGLATRRDFSFFFFCHDRSKGCRDLQTRWRGRKKNSYFSELESFSFLSLLLNVVHC